MGDIVKFEFNEPVEVSLKFNEPKLLETQYGERAMYTLTDERKMFLDILTAAKIRALRVAPGDCFYVVKRKKGRIQEFDVFRDTDESLPATASVPSGPPIVLSEEVIRAAHQPIASNPVKKLSRAPDLAKVIPPSKFAGNGDLEKALEESIEQVESRKLGHQPDGTFAVEAPPRKPAAVAQTSRPAWCDTLISQTNALVDVYAEALAHASKHGIAVKPDDVRSLLVTSFIQLAGKGGTNRAA